MCGIWKQRKCENDAGQMKSWLFSGKMNLVRTEIKRVWSKKTFEKQTEEMNY